MYDVGPGSTACVNFTEPGAASGGCGPRSPNDPPSSCSFTFAGAVPVFLKVSVCVVVLPSTCDDELDAGVTDSTAALSEQSARVAESAATFTVWLSLWYGGLAAVNWCDPVSEENSQ